MGVQKECFVCKKPINEQFTQNPEVNLPVCENCRGTETEKETVKEFLNSLADGFVCGCI